MKRAHFSSVIVLSIVLIKTVRQTVMLLLKMINFIDIKYSFSY